MKPQRPNHKTYRRPKLIRASFFIWLIVPLLLLGIYGIYGLPHMIWSYTYRDDGQGRDPLAYRYYFNCVYIGPYGDFKRQAQAGTCSWVRFFKKKETLQ